MRSPLPLVLALAAFPALAAPEAKIDPEHFTDHGNAVHVFKPHELAPPALTALKAPKGFELSMVASGLGNARMLAIAHDGTIYLTRRTESDVLMLKMDAEGKASAPVTVAARPGLHGIALHEGKVYLASVHEVFVADILPDGRFGPLAMIIDDLPDAGQHHTRTVQVGPDDMLYISVGSTCNECTEPNPEAATILRASLDGKHRSIVATGLRDTIGWGWQPQTGELWGMDHGIDWFGDEVQPEELNRIEQGKHYGWPYFYADNQPNHRLDPPNGLKRADWKRVSIPMVKGYDAHSAPMQMAFYNAGQFPKEYEGDAFVSLRGSWNRKDPKGYEVVRIDFENGQAKSVTPFITGFVTAKGEHGRLCGNAVASDGSLLFTDDRNGVLYRARYVGDAKERAAHREVPAAAMRRQAEAGSPVPVAVERAETKSPNGLALASPAFAEGKTIPLVHSAYDQGISLPLGWKKALPGIQSYALIMEDPDGPKVPNPVIHWVAWNIPGDLLSLPAALPAQHRLNMPEGMRQGVNSNGKIGYLGPRPPEGDPAHHYHVALFGLDTMLDLPLNANRDELLKAMKGHVLSHGEMIGTFTRPAEPAKP